MNLPSKPIYVHFDDRRKSSRLGKRSYELVGDSRGRSSGHWKRVYLPITAIAAIEARMQEAAIDTRIAASVPRISAFATRVAAILESVQEVAIAILEWLLTQLESLLTQLV